jgi:hypothetical protein
VELLVLDESFKDFNNCVCVALFDHDILDLGEPLNIGLALPLGLLERLRVT